MTILHLEDWWRKLYDAIQYWAASAQVTKESIWSDVQVFCASSLWEKVRYAQDLPAHYIDFPGEYEINWYLIECRVSEELLSYQITSPDQTVFAIVPNEAAFDVWTFTDSSTIYCLTQQVADEAVKQEVWWECVVLSKVSAWQQWENLESSE